MVQCWIERHVPKTENEQNLKMYFILTVLNIYCMMVDMFYRWCCFFHFPRCLAACCCHVPPANPAMLPFHWPIAATVLCILISRKWLRSCQLPMQQQQPQQPPARNDLVTQAMSSFWYILSHHALHVANQ